MHIATNEAASVRVHKPAPGTGWRDHYLFDVSKMSREKADRMVSKKMIRLLFEHHRDLVVPEYAKRFWALEAAKNPKPEPVSDMPIHAEVIELPDFIPKKSTNSAISYGTTRDLSRFASVEFPKLEAILFAVSLYFNVPRAKLVAHRRTMKETMARQIAAYLMSELTPCSLTMIGHKLGGRDHTTIIHANRKIARLISEDEFVARDVNLIKNFITVATEVF